MTTDRDTVFNYSEADKALGHRMRAFTGMTDKCDYCGAMVNDCRNWPGDGGGSVFEPCKRAPVAAVRPPCGCRDGTCESKPDHACRTAAEIARAQAVVKIQMVEDDPLFLRGLRVIPSRYAMEVQTVFRVVCHRPRARRKRWQVRPERVERPGAYEAGGCIYMHPDLVAMLRAAALAEGLQ